MLTLTLILIYLIAGLIFFLILKEDIEREASTWRFNETDKAMIYTLIVLTWLPLVLYTLTVMLKDKNN